MALLFGLTSSSNICSAFPGDAEFAQCDYPYGERAVGRAIALAPNVMRHHYALGVLYCSLEREDEARVEFKRTAQLPILIARDVHDQEAAGDYFRELTRTN